MRTNKIINFGTSGAVLRFRSEFAHTLDVTYSQETDYRYRDAEGQKDFGVLDLSTKTITWTIGSSLPIVSGTFLDGSPWVEDNGDIHLVAISPSPEDIQVNSADYVGVSFTTNESILNPDFGKISNEYLAHGPNGDGVTFPTGVQMAWPTVSDYVQTTDGVVITDSSLDPTYMLPLDGRSGLNVDKSDPETQSGGTVTEFYNSSTDQIWDREGVTLQAHDMILSSISHNDKQDNGPDVADIVGKNYWNGYKREPLYDLLGCLTVVPVDAAVDYSLRFRPPVNWDPADRANAPFFEENAGLDAHNFTYPTQGMYDNTPITDWDVRVKDYFDPTKWSGTYDGAGPLRLGSVRLMVGGTEQDDTVQGCTRSMDVIWSEYASDEGLSIEAMTMLAFDSTYPAEDRTKVRRALTQRGIDIYGGFRSLGKWNSPNGGHSEPYDWYLLWAYLGSADGALRDDIRDCMDGNLGNVANGTNSSLSDFDSGLYNIGSVRGQLRKYSSASDYISPARINDLDVIGTGTIVEDGVTINYVEVNPPLCNIAGQNTVNNGPTITPHDRLYHVSGNDDRGTGGANPTGQGSRGRWGFRNNQDEMNREVFSGMYVRNPDTGIISRIIASEGTTDPDTTKYGGNWYTDTPQRFYLQEDIGTITNGKIDLSSFVAEDVGVRDVFRSINYATSVQSMSGAINYTWTTVRGQLILPFIRNALIAQGDTLPEYWKVPYEYVTRLWTDPVQTCIVQDEGLLSGRSYTITNNTFPANNGQAYKDLWKALIRQEVLNGALPAPDPTGKVAKINSWPTCASDTWIEVNVNAVSNVTAVLEPVPSELNTNTTAAVEDLSGNTICTGTTPDVTNRFRRIITSDGRDGVYVQSRSSRGFDYTDVAGKSLYAWQCGATNPIELVLDSETVPSSDVRVWDQTWKLPTSTPVWPQTATSWSGTEVYTWFYADPQP